MPTTMMASRHAAELVQNISRSFLHGGSGATINIPAIKRSQVAIVPRRPGAEKTAFGVT